MKTGKWLYDLGVRGTLTSADLTAHFSPAKENYLEIQKRQQEAFNLVTAK